MITTRVATGLGQPPASSQRVAGLFKRSRDAFQKWRKRQGLQTLCDLSDRELMDIGTTCDKIEYVASTRWRMSNAPIILMLCSACVLVFASEAGAQCAARDVLNNRLGLKEAPSIRVPQTLVRSAVDVPTWKKITVGTFSDSFALRDALNAAGCGVGGTAEEVLARPAFSLSATRTDVELLAVSAAELGFQAETVSLGQIYARAQQLGFALAAAEIGPQLRLQYFDQPIGEFLIIAMEPIKTWKGEPVILTVANGGAGLILIAQDGRIDAEIFVGSRLLFVRSNKVEPREAAVVHY
ncbi:uncharacterized protein YjiS (DUF1127 family) [Bradyrhizobium sp. AZCC 1678]|uniref:DUF1127 domain-containing protein n=1 Tax=Bradyrhizobium sp. AZCC 1678 TaxID=3117030 RepID=UPI003072AAF4